MTDAYVSEDELGIAKLPQLGSWLLRLDRYANTPEKDWGDSVASFPFIRTVILKALPKHVHLCFYFFYTFGQIKTHQTDTRYEGWCKKGN